MNIGDTAAAKNLCRLFDLTEWPEHGFRKYLLFAGSQFVWMDYEPENESLELESALAETPAGFNPEWLKIFLAGSGFEENLEGFWLGLHNGRIILRTIYFPAHLDVEALSETLAAFISRARAWRDLLSGKNLEASPGTLGRVE